MDVLRRDHGPKGIAQLLQHHGDHLLPPGAGDISIPNGALGQNNIIPLLRRLPRRGADADVGHVARHHDLVPPRLLEEIVQIRAGEGSGVLFRHDLFALFGCQLCKLFREMGVRGEDGGSVGGAMDDVDDGGGCRAVSCQEGGDGLACRGDIHGLEVAGCISGFTQGVRAIPRCLATPPSRGKCEIVKGEDLLTRSEHR